MKRFAYACLGVLALVLAFHLGASTSRASTGRVVALGEWGSYVFAVLDDGQIMRYGTDGWRDIHCSLPLPVDQLAFFTGSYAMDTSDNIYGPSWVGGNCAWPNGGPPPGPVALEPSTWGQIKAQDPAR